MLKFPPALIVHKGNVFYLFYAVSGLLMTLAAGGQCLDAALRTAQDPDNLLRLSNALAGLVGLGYRSPAAGEVRSLVKQKLKKLHFTESFCILLNMTKVPLQDMHGFYILHAVPEKQSHLESTPANWISKQRSRTYYVLLCGGSRQPIMMLRITSRGSVLKTYSLTPRRRRTDFSRRRCPGDVVRDATAQVFLFLGERPRPVGTGSDAKDATDERGPSGLVLGLSALCVVLLWMFLPPFALCVVTCLLWRERRHFC